MSFSRRGVFGFLAGATAVVAAAKSKASKPEPDQPKPEFFVGQIRAVHSHYETQWPPATMNWDGGPPHAFAIAPCAGLYTAPVAVVHYEQWDGTGWKMFSPDTRSFLPTTNQNSRGEG